jgi:hypothetical protein
MDYLVIAAIFWFLGFVIGLNVRRGLMRFVLRRNEQLDNELAEWRNERDEADDWKQT